MPGDDAYTGQRPEIAELIPGNAFKILDIGCSQGDVGAYIKRTPGREVFGIEIDKEKADKASLKLDRVVVGDVERMEPPFDDGYFDCIIFADVLEHLRDPLKVLLSYKRFLKKDGSFIISIPNVRHIKVVFNLLVKGEWKYEPSGIMDESHLRYFTLSSSRRLLESAHLEPVLKKRIFSLKGSRLFNFFTFGIFKDFLTSQYIYMAGKKQR